MDWHEFKKIEDSLWGHGISVLCIDGQVVKGPFAQHNAADVDEDEEVEVDIEYRTHIVSIPINEIVSITVLD